MISELYQQTYAPKEVPMIPDIRWTSVSKSLNNSQRLWCSCVELTLIMKMRYNLNPERHGGSSRSRPRAMGRTRGCAKFQWKR